MRIIHITPGFGGKFYCQNCIYSLNILKTMRKLGHDGILIPMYIPVACDEKENVDLPIFYGAVGIYLKERFSFIKNIPAPVKKCLNSRPFLKLVSLMAGSADPAGLEEMTLSVMRGETGSQREELSRLTGWISSQGRFDAVHLSNALLIGIGVQIRKELGIPVFCNLDDEDSWIDKMRGGYAAEAWKLIGEGAKVIDGYISASRYYADTVISKTGIPEKKIFIVPKGIDPEEYNPAPPSFRPPVIGFLSRIAREKGIDILIDAFILLKKRLKKERRDPGLRLRISGGMAGQDKRFFKKQVRKLKKSGYLDAVGIKPYLFREDIRAFFDGMTLLTVPSRESEAHGIFILESLASGKPVLVPAHGSYPEIIKKTGGGVLYENNTPVELAGILYNLLNEREWLCSLGRAGRKSVAEYFTSGGVAEEILGIYRNLSKQ